MLHDVFDADGNLVASIPISEAALKLMNAGLDAETQYHTPKALQGTMGARAGKFTLYKNDLVRARDVGPVKEYAAIQAAYRALAA